MTFLPHLFILTVISQINIGECKLTFPNDFLFGASTSSYQFEGAWNVDGRGPSIWDTFTHQHPEYIVDHSNGDNATGFYYKYKEDIKFTKDMGMKVFRLSISWSRIMPHGFPNNINQRGLNFYNNVIDEVLKNGLIPMVVMYHWDLPQTLQNFGGWTNNEIIIYFVEYAKVLLEHFGDRVKWWTTFNEPISIVRGYEKVEGYLAPGSVIDGVNAYLAAHNILKAHALVYHMYDCQFRPKQHGKMSIANAYSWAYPATKEDVGAMKLVWEFTLGWFVHPIFSKEGDYPKIMKERIAKFSKEQGFPKSRLPSFTPEEIESIRGTADFFDLHVYTILPVSLGESGPNPSFLRDVGVIPQNQTTFRRSKSVPWLLVSPEAISHTICCVIAQYGNWDIFITENGYADDGELEDDARVEYLAMNMIEILKTRQRCNSKLLGYVVWGLTDNFEWTYGYTGRFGLYHVDFNDPEKKRTPKKSSYFMKNVTTTLQIPEEFYIQDEKLTKKQKLDKTCLL